MMLSLSPSRARYSILAAALAAGCLLSLSAPDPAEPSPRRRLRVGQSPRRHRQLRVRDWLDKRTRLRAAHNKRFHASWWEDVGYDLDWACGRFKCFFRSKKDPDRGYLVADVKGQGSHSRHTYEYAKDLEAEFGIRHFLTGPPYLEYKPYSFKKRLPDGPVFTAKGIPKDGPREKLGGAMRLVVQDIVAAPRGSKVSKCRYFEKDVFDYFIENGEEGWDKTLMEELAATKTLLDPHPEMAWDFQIMIDLKGRVYHLDFDRTWRINPAVMRKEAKKKRECLDEAMAYIGSSMNKVSVER